MSETTDNGEVREETKQEIMAIQEAVHPSVLGMSIEDRIANIHEHVLPQYKANLFGNIYNFQEGLDAVRAGNMQAHTSIKHDLKFFSEGNTVICFGLADGADYDKNWEKVSENLNFPFCDVFVRVDGKLRILAVTASAVPPENPAK